MNQNDYKLLLSQQLNANSSLERRLNKNNGPREP